MTHHDAEFDIARAVQEHGQFLRRLAGALTSGDVSPEDLVQETWLVALQPPSRPIRNPRGFLATVMNRRAQRAARSASHRQRRERRVARTEADESPRHEDLLRELTDRLISLGEDSRRLLIGRYYEGLTARELARREGLPVATVETRLRRALATLRDRLDASSPSGRAGWSHAMAALAGGRAMPDSMSSWLGVGLVSKKLIAGVVAFLLLLAAWFGLGRLDADSKRPRLSGPESGAVEAGLDPVTRAKSEGKPVVSRSRSRAQPANASAPGTQEARRLGLLGTLVVHARIEESRPAPGLRVSATTLDSEWGLVEVSGRTDALGTFVFEGLPVGRYEVCALRGGQQTVRVSAGQTTSMTLNLSGGRRVEGRVVDQDGRPLPRAEIWLSMAVDPNHGDLVDATDDRGRFQLEAVDSHRLAVFADGFEPGVVEIPSQGSSFETTIRLNRGGSVLDVRVEDEAGQPIANAYVMARQRIAALGFEAPAMVEVEEGHHPGSDALSWTGRTDSEGHLRWKGLARGPVTLWARAPGFAVSTAVVDPRAAAEATLVLADEHRLEGRVLDAHGYPMPEVRIDAGPYRGPRRRRCLSDADGHFVLRGLAPGALTLDLEAADRGDARVRVQIGASRVVTRRDLQFATGPTLEGRVVDENDAPVAGLKVRARLADFTNSVSWRSGLTDANGRFELRGCDEGLHRVEIYDADNDEQPLTVVAGLEPRPLPHLIRLDAGSRASAWLTGRLVSSDGEAAPGATVVIFGEGILAASSRPVDASTGGFRFGPFPSGDLQLFIEAPGQVALSRQVTVEAAKTLDLGTIRFPRPGYFEGVLKVGDGGPRGLPSGSIVTPDRQHRDFRVEGDRVLSPPLAPGLHTLQISVAGRIERSIGFVIHEGETTRAELVLEPGCPIRIRFEEQAEDAAVRVKSFRLRLASISGVPVFDHEYRVKDGVGFRLDHVLAPGEYRLELRNDLGGEHSESFVLAAPGGPERLFTMRIGGR